VAPVSLALDPYGAALIPGIARRKSGSAGRGADRALPLRKKYPAHPSDDLTRGSRAGV